MELRWGFEGVTKGLRRGYEGIQGKSALRYGLATVSATAHCLIARHPLRPLSIRGRRQQSWEGVEPPAAGRSSCPAVRRNSERKTGGGSQFITHSAWRER